MSSAGAILCGVESRIRSSFHVSLALGLKRVDHGKLSNLQNRLHTKPLHWCCRVLQDEWATLRVENPLRHGLNRQRRHPPPICSSDHRQRRMPDASTTGGEKNVSNRHSLTTSFAAAMTGIELYPSCFNQRLVCSGSKQSSWGQQQQQQVFAVVGRF